MTRAEALALHRQRTMELRAESQIRRALDEAARDNPPAPRPDPTADERAGPGPIGDGPTRGG